MLTLRRTSRGVDLKKLVPGHDATITLPPEHAARLQMDVLIDDHLGASERTAIDSRALAALQSWQVHASGVFSAGAAPLAEIWRGELLMEVFLEVERVVAGVRATVSTYGVSQLSTGDLDRELAVALRAVMAAEGVAVFIPDHYGSPPRYPSEAAVPPHQAQRLKLRQRVAQHLVNVIGAPNFVRGRVVVLPYHSTLPVLRRLADGSGPRPVVVVGSPPPPRLALAAARRGGWIGRPGLLAARRGRVLFESQMRELLALGPESQRPLDVLRHRRAVRFLTDRAAGTTAQFLRTKRAFRGGRVRTVLLPFDEEPAAKLLVAVARLNDIPVLTIQHGYEPIVVATRPGTSADFVGVWNAEGLSSFPPDRRPRIRVTGNPGAAVSQLSRTGPTAGSRPRALILVEHPARESVVIDQRVGARHLSTALAGLEASGFPWHVIVRPHPSDDPRHYVLLLEDLGYPNAVVDAETPIGLLLSNVDLCVGACSTVALQTAEVGLPLLMLDVTGIELRAPLNGSGGVLRVVDVAGVAREAGRLLNGTQVPGRSALLEAMGGSVDAIASVADWLEELVAEVPPPNF